VLHSAINPIRHSAPAAATQTYARTVPAFSKVPEPPAKAQLESMLQCNHQQLHINLVIDVASCRIIIGQSLSVAVVADNIAPNLRTIAGGSHARAGNVQCSHAINTRSRS